MDIDIQPTHSNKGNKRDSYDIERNSSESSLNIYVQIFKYTSIYMRLFSYICVYLYSFIGVNIYISVDIPVYINIYVFINF